MHKIKRLLDCNTSDIRKMNAREILKSIKLCEGRVITQEISLFGDSQLLSPVSDAEIASAFGADLILLNAFDVNAPKIAGIDCAPEDVIKTLKLYTGRIIGLNLEPVRDENSIDDFHDIPEGRKATKENALKAMELGFDFITLTGNPSTGVTNEAIIEALKVITPAVSEKMFMIAGKMHAAGSSNESGENIISKETVEAFIDSGADVILIPAAGTVPGIDFNSTKELIQLIHSKGKMVLTAIGTSQEGADPETIGRIALMAKMAGADIHHIGDAAIGGMDAENLMRYSEVIRGKRHTFMRMARSINR